MLSRSILAGAAVLLAVAGSNVSAQSQDANPETNGQVTVTGCVSGLPVNSGDFTLTDANNGSKYRLTGKSVRKYAGQRVEVVSGRSKRLAIRGGLWPSPNAAGQAGAIDPAQESIARQPGGGGTGAGTATLPELNVVRVRGVEGPCK